MDAHILMDGVQVEVKRKLMTWTAGGNVIGMNLE